MIYIYCFGTNKKCDTIDEIKNSGGFHIGMKFNEKRKMKKEIRKSFGEDMIYQILTKLAPNMLPETAERKRLEKLRESLLSR